MEKKFGAATEINVKRWYVIFKLIYLQSSKLNLIVQGLKGVSLEKIYTCVNDNSVHLRLQIWNKIQTRLLLMQARIWGKHNLTKNKITQFIYLHTPPPPSAYQWDNLTIFLYQYYWVQCGSLNLYFYIFYEFLWFSIGFYEYMGY